MNSIELQRRELAPHAGVVSTFANQTSFLRRMWRMSAGIPSFLSGKKIRPGEICGWFITLIWSLDHLERDVHPQTSYKILSSRILEDVISHL
jgi:hypothetical protein